MHDPAQIQARFVLQHPGFCLDIDLQLPGRGITALFGHSGSGKTSCLRCVAGLEQAGTGYLAVNGDCWQDSARGLFVPTYRRPIGYVFQEANLFAHLDVRDNLLYGSRRIPRAARQVALQQAVDLLGIGHLLQRLPGRLSGGERQRVGIARALLTSPRLLLMDEPLASLDLQRRQEVMPYLERLQRELDIPLLYVSHAPDEVARLADHLVVLEEGRVRACGPLQETLLRHDLPMFQEEDAQAVLHGLAGAFDEHYGLQAVQLDKQSRLLQPARQAVAPGTPLRLKVRARDVGLSLAQVQHSSLLNHLAVRVCDWQEVPQLSYVQVRLQLPGGQQLLARITRYSFDQLGIHSGQALWAQLKSVSLLNG